MLVLSTYIVVDCIDGKVLGSLGDDDLYCVTGLTSIVCCGCSIISLVVSLVSCCSNNINEMSIIIMLNLFKYQFCLLIMFVVASLCQLTHFFEQPSIK